MRRPKRVQRTLVRRPFSFVAELSTREDVELMLRIIMKGATALGFVPVYAKRRIGAGKNPCFPHSKVPAKCGG